MLMPSIFGEDLFDRFMNDFPFDDRDFKKMEKKLYGHHGKNLMKTDIRETDGSYELEMDLPGFKKDEIKVLSERWLSDHQRCQGLDQDEQEKEDRKIYQKRALRRSLRENLLHWRSDYPGGYQRRIQAWYPETDHSEKGSETGSSRK